MSNDTPQSLMRELYALVHRFEALSVAGDRKFTPDGHLVGSIGEMLAADLFNLKLMPASNKGYDAITPDGRTVEIKATQRNAVAFRHHEAGDVPDIVIALRILPDGGHEVVYHGPGAPVFRLFEDKLRPPNGQHQVSLSKLETIQQASSR